MERRVARSLEDGIVIATETATVFVSKSVCDQAHQHTDLANADLFWLNRQM